MPRGVVFAPHFIGHGQERGAVGSLGPGRYEGLRVSLRRRRQRDGKPPTVAERMVWNERAGRFDWKAVRRYSYRRDDQFDPILVKVTGAYTVYCGEGWEHTVLIDQSERVYPRDDRWDDAYRAWKEHAADGAAELAAELVERELEDWSDPCQEIPDDCPWCGFELANNDYPPTHRDGAGDACPYVVEA